MTFCCFHRANPSYCNPFPSAFGGARRASGGGDVRSSARIRPSVSAESLSSVLAIASYEWVRDDVLKYKYTLTSVTSVFVLQRHVKLSNV